MTRAAFLLCLLAIGPLAACTNPKQPRNCEAEVGSRVVPQMQRPATKDAAGDYVCE